MSLIPRAMTSGLFDSAPQLWHSIGNAFGYVASCLYSAAVWADHRAVLREDAPRNAIAELTARVRHPYRHAATHPITTVRRKWSDGGRADGEQM